jgi:hypothetical protein
MSLYAFWKERDGKRKREIKWEKKKKKILKTIIAVLLYKEKRIKLEHFKELCNIIKEFPLKRRLKKKKVFLIVNQRNLPFIYPSLISTRLLIGFNKTKLVMDSSTKKIKGVFFFSQWTLY